MERKIGEIFEYKGEWYQCVEKHYCNECVFRDAKCDDVRKILGNCSVRNRSDKKSVIFKKLEKIGEPFTSVGKLYQHYKVFDIDNVCGDGFWCVHNYKAKTLTIEIKQNKEDMEENKITFPKEDNALTRTVYAYVNGKISDKELIRSIKEMSDEYPYNKNNLKPFSWELAKQGKPVCTRDGRKARIICFDAKGNKPLIILSEIDGKEVILRYTEKGQSDNFHSPTPREDDLMMLPEKKEGWVNVYKTSINYECGTVFSTEQEAKNKANNNRIATIRIEWEE